tara:strand:- start:80 stop:496 length:417 start_codon:yes stop_codon:yes gene_type:complete
MLISCSACNSKYLVNSADLKPNGRTVKCAKCANTWFQRSSINEEDNIIQSKQSFQEDKKDQNKVISNLPSTYVNEEKASVFNSLILIFFVILLIYGFWFYNKHGITIIPLLHYYLLEFYFNINLIIKDIANIVKEILG